MRVLSKSTLRDFWEVYTDAEQDLRTWYKEFLEADYETPNEVIADYPTADIVGNGRVVFNICHNKYRLIAFIHYEKHTVLVRFIGTHKEYDKIKDIKNI